MVGVAHRPKHVVFIWSQRQNPKSVSDISFGQKHPLPRFRMIASSTDAYCTVEQSLEIPGFIEHPCGCDIL